MNLSEFYYPIPEKNINDEKEVTYNCEKCGILQKKALHTPRFSPIIGDKYNGLVIVPTNPTKEEDAKGSLLTSSIGTILRATAYKLGFNLVQNAAIVPIIRCAIGKPTDLQGKCCFPELDKQLKILQPKVIIPMGSIPFKHIAHNNNKIPNTLIRNRLIPNYFYNAVVFPMWDINEIQGKGQKHIQDACVWDFERIIKLFLKRFKYRTRVDEFLENRKILKGIFIKQIKTMEEATKLFSELNKLKSFSLDYEATNAYPYDDNFEIICISFGLKKSGWVIHESLWKDNLFNRNIIYNKLEELLTNPNIKKIIQNAKFEDNASRFILGIKKIVNSECTMLASHVIDERTGATSLDFQNLIRFGIPPYNQLVHSLLEPKEGEKINKIREIPIDQLIEYSGLDAITTFNNWDLLDNVLLSAYPKGRENYEMLNKGHWTYANMQQRGIHVNEAEYINVSKKLEEEARIILKRIYALPEFIDFNNYMKTKAPIKKTKKGDVLKKIKETINAQRIDGQPRSNNTNDRNGLSKSIGERITAIRRRITFH